MSLTSKIESTLLSSHLKPSHLEVIDARGDGRHLIINITSNSFANLSIINKHKLVYKELDDYFKKDEIHAVNINAKHE
jgi:acid stress-induced BolA-like protein IbaG/YrbA